MHKLLIAAMTCLLVFSMNTTNVSAKTTKACIVGAKASTAKVIPDVKYPFTFNCQHCQMKITIKTKDDWNKNCGACACGVTNLDCYKPPKK